MTTDYAHLLMCELIYPVHLSNNCVEWFPVSYVYVYISPVYYICYYIYVSAASVNPAFNVLTLYVVYCCVCIYMYTYCCYSVILAEDTW